MLVFCRRWVITSGQEFSTLPGGGWSREVKCAASTARVGGQHHLLSYARTCRAAEHASRDRGADDLIRVPERERVVRHLALRSRARRPSRWSRNASVGVARTIASSVRRPQAPTASNCGERALTPLGPGATPTGRVRDQPTGRARERRWPGAAHTLCSEHVSVVRARSRAGRAPRTDMFAAIDNTVCCRTRAWTPRLLHLTRPSAPAT